jgi:hypothetical protein
MCMYVYVQSIMCVYSPLSLCVCIRLPTCPNASLASALATLPLHLATRPEDEEEERGERERRRGGRERS